MAKGNARGERMVFWTSVQRHVVFWRDAVWRKAARERRDVVYLTLYPRLGVDRDLELELEIAPDIDEADDSGEKQDSPKDARQLALTAPTP